ncbi:hypothetical protein DB88DRAFT_475660 [Papiliotrema laurentii]|uniref:Uncharacterized protein n=1 Tax=Papiliotrema laurentii TaxID=5418 RepID=A0AAD9CSP0_PAPLA|nr:hypothetical protein DB88DRAFT_475660 [Papiliotrema laurentii]
MFGLGKFLFLTGTAVSVFAQTAAENATYFPHYHGTLADRRLEYTVETRTPGTDTSALTPRHLTAPNATCSIHSQLGRKSHEAGVAVSMGISLGARPATDVVETYQTVTPYTAPEPSAARRRRARGLQRLPFKREQGFSYGDIRSSGASFSDLNAQDCLNTIGAQSVELRGGGCNGEEALDERDGRVCARHTSQVGSKESGLQLSNHNKTVGFDEELRLPPGGNHSVTP